MPYTSPNLNDNLTLQRLLNRNNTNNVQQQDEKIPNDLDINHIPSPSSPIPLDLLLKPPPSIPFNNNCATTNNSSNLKHVEKISTPTQIVNSDNSEIIKFAKESTQLYSYAQLSPNSLALRLNVLKRSLEILSERPELIASHERELPIPFNTNGNNELVRHHSNNQIQSNISIQNNASSAALSALFRQQQQQQQQHQNPLSPTTSIPSPISRRLTLLDMTQSEQQLDLIDTVSSDVKDIIKLLSTNQLIEFKSQQPQKIVNDLHDLSLLNLNDSKQEDLKVRLLHALATPFVENANSNTNQLAMMERHGSSNISLSTLQINQQQQQQPPSSSSSSQRPYHSMSSNKKVAPQAIFTCGVEAPWSMKLANDLACLMFGVSRSSLKAFTLMDLISSRSRDFVLSKLMKINNNNNNGGKSTIFAGEIIAIQRPNNNFAWASVWGKRKGDIMILIFDQIPCDSGDLVICKKSDKKFTVMSFNSNYGNSLFAHDLIGKEVSKISKPLALDIETLSRSVDVSTQIKKTRYYTISIDNKNVPSAITAVTMDSIDSSSATAISATDDADIPMVKLHLHSMPYIAGTIVISAKDYTILSYNAAACKNLFGQGKDLMNSSIDFLIPNFTKLLRYLIFKDHSLQLKNGLVLPEHYFRRAASLVACGFDDDELEFLFLNSDGIIGKHRDGNLLKIDVQLRVTSTETFMLWVTYSRNLTKKGDKQVHFDKAIIGNRSVMNVNGGDNEMSKDLNHQQIDEDIDLPSQLQLLPENESEINSCGSSVDGLSRKNSLRSPPHSVHHSSSSLDLKQQRQKQRSIEMTPSNNKIRIPSNSNNTDNSNSSSHSNSSTFLCKTPPSSNDALSRQNSQHRSIKAIDLNGTVVKHYSERELLNMENEAIKEIEKKSTLWPREVGLKRREKKLTDFIILKNMGEGAYGKVVQAQHKDDPNYKLIIKCIVKERILVDTWVRDRKLGTIPSEIQIMNTLNSNPHPNIMRIVDFFEDSGYYYLETPQHGDPPGIDLFDLIELQTSMSELECKLIFRQIVQAINHLHKNGIVHRDIKDENLIIDNQGIIKLIDFGSASYVKNGPFDVFVGTMDYASPEVLNGKPYQGEPQDVWAMGVLLYTLIYKENPFYNVDEIMEGELRIPFVTSDECISLIKRILNRDVNERPSMKDVLQDPWLCF